MTSDGRADCTHDRRCSPWSCSPRSPARAGARQRRFRHCDLDLDTHSQDAGRVRGEIDREMLLGPPKSKLVV